MKLPIFTVQFLKASKLKNLFTIILISILSNINAQTQSAETNNISSVAYLSTCSLSLDNEAKNWCTKHEINRLILANYQPPFETNNYNNLHEISFTLNIDSLGKVYSHAINSNVNDSVKMAIQNAIQKLPSFVSALKGNKKVNDQINIDIRCSDLKKIRFKKLNSTGLIEDIPMMFVSQMPCLEICCENENNVIKDRCTKEEITYFINQNINIPKDKMVSGTIFVRFVVNKEGNVENIEILKGINSTLDNYAKQVVSKLPKFKPAYNLGKPVSIFYNIPIKITVN